MPCWPGSGGWPSRRPGVDPDALDFGPGFMDTCIHPDEGPSGETCEEHTHGVCSRTNWSPGSRRRGAGWIRYPPLWVVHPPPPPSDGVAFGQVGPGHAVIGDLTVEDGGDVFADRPVAAVGLDEDPLEEVVGQVDGPALDLPGGAGVGGLRASSAGPPAPPGPTPARGRRRPGRRPATPGRGRPRRRRPLQDPRQMRPRPALFARPWAMTSSMNSS